MSTVKKDFVELVELLEANKDKKVSTIMGEILELATSKKKSKTFKVDENGNITEIFCYYHKEWEPVEWYGKKSSSTTGYNTMCKTGVNQWTRQQAEAKKAKEKLLEDFAEGKVSQEEIKEKLEEIEIRRKRIEPLECE